VPIDDVPSAGTQPQQSKRRQYAAGQNTAYYGAPEPAAAGYAAGGPAPQLFTPGLAGDNQLQQQQQQQQQQQHQQQQQQQQQQAQGGYYGQPQQPGYADGGYGQQSVYNQQQPIANLTDQFGQLNVAGQKGLRLQTTNLLTSPPDPRELQQPPPETILPPNATLTTSPFSNADPSYQRSTINAIPTTHALLNKSKLPLALVIAPYRSTKDDEEQVPLVADTVIARCRRCRTYINPFVQFIDNGNRWRCCMCAMSNEIPQLFDWDQQRNQPGDRWARAELNYSVVEFIAPTEYMVRPPQPAVYVFLIDVSHAAIQSGLWIFIIRYALQEKLIPISGMVATATRTLLENLDRIPNEDDRAKVSILAFDTSLYFFSIQVSYLLRLDIIP
jgi:protein transport protein SEC24